MSYLHYHHALLHMEDVSLKSIAAQYGTPCYVYSRAAIEANWCAFDQAFNAIPHKICYAVKANSNISILGILAKLNSGFDIVSLGELERVIKASGDTQKVVFSGVGKTEFEIEQAMKNNIYCFNVESEAELQRINHIATTLNKTINIALRINPDIAAETHSHILTGLKENKFGIAIDEIIPLSRTISNMPSLRLIGIACHIGSQLLNLTPFLQVIDLLLAIYQQLANLGITLTHLNVGGGLGIRYKDEDPPSIQEYATALQNKMAGYPIELILEPGRSIIGNTGVLLTRIEYLKHSHHKNFAIVDAGMNDLVRPALYDAWQDILPVEERTGVKQRYDIAGPVCESSDFLGKNRELSIEAGDLLAVTTTGAYGFSMSSNYNSRCKPAEILIDGNESWIIRRRETIDELFAPENLIIRKMQD